MQVSRVADQNHLLTLIQSLSSTLINIDSEYQSEVQRLYASHVTREFSAVIGRTLQDRHNQRREPYVRNLAELRSRASEVRSA